MTKKRTNTINLQRAIDLYKLRIIALEMLLNYEDGEYRSKEELLYNDILSSLIQAYEIKEISLSDIIAS